MSLTFAIVVTSPEVAAVAAATVLASQEGGENQVMSPVVAYGKGTVTMIVHPYEMHHVSYPPSYT